ncbi:MAG: glycosyltransferase [Candidatus Aquicultor sp.]
MDGGLVEYFDFRSREILGVNPLNHEKLVVIHSVARWLSQTETWQYNQIKYLPSNIVNHVVCEEIENLEQFPLPNIHALPKAPQWRIFLDRGLRRLQMGRYPRFLVEQAIQRHGQVLHSHFGYMGWANMKAARRVGLKHVVTFYGLDVSHLPRLDPRWYERYKLLFDTIDGVLCEGPFMAKSIVELGCPESKAWVHHLGVRVNEIVFKPSAFNPGEPLRVLIAGAFREKKGVPYALEALGRLKREIPLEITVIGDANSEPRNQSEKKRILNVMDKYDLWPQTRMLGYQAHNVLFEEAYNHHVFLSPSVTASDGDTEGGAPVTIIEMMALGLPVVSTKHCDIPEVVKHGRTGLLAQERDVDGLVNHLAWLVDNPKKWPEMLDTARKHVEAGYDAQRQGEQLSAIYQELVS